MVGPDDRHTVLDWGDAALGDRVRITTEVQIS
jgi:hypothetical protein